MKKPIYNELSEKEIQQIPSTYEDFDDLTLKAIDETLSSLGEQPKTAIYLYLKKRYCIDKKEIPQRIEEFSDALEDLLKVGAAQLEILFMKNLFLQLKNMRGDLFFECAASNVTFREYTRLMKHTYITKK